MQQSLVDVFKLWVMLLALFQLAACGSSGDGNQTPIAAADSFSATGNTQKTFAAPGVMANDSDVDTPTIDLSVTAGTIATANGGSVSMSSNGSFTYTPPAGVTSDSFSYTLNDNDVTSPQISVGTVTIALSDMVWYVDDSAGAGNGTSATPFNTLAAGATAASSGETIFVYAGTGSYTGGITLTTAGQLIGEGEGLSVDGLTIAAGTAPSITAAVGTDVITLANGNTIKGVAISGGKSGIRGENISGLTVHNVSLTNTGDDSISLLAPSATVEISDSAITATSIDQVDGLNIDTTGQTDILILNVSDTDFSGLGDTSGNGLQNAIFLDDAAVGVGVVHVTITGSTFVGTYGKGVHLFLSGSTGGDSITIGGGDTIGSASGNTFTGVRGTVMDLDAGNNTDISYNIRGNILDGNGLSVSHAIYLFSRDSVTVSATISANRFSDIGDDITFDDSITTDDMVMKLLVGNGSAAASNVVYTITDNIMNNNNARGVVIDAYGASTVGATVTNNSFNGHLGNNGLDVRTEVSGTSVCLAASGNGNSASSDEIVLEELSGSSLDVTGAGTPGDLEVNNNDMTVNATGDVAFGSTCTP
ncbi:MAG: Ig-like domain-containing protein [Gammaproteobacteria bacterium]